MTSLSCLALIIAMEATNQNEKTRTLVADAAIERAYQENLSICESMKVKATYSWYWDGKPNKIDKKVLSDITKLAIKEVKSPTYKGMIYFNECWLGKRWKTKNRMIRSEKLCFY